MTALLDYRRSFRARLALLMGGSGLALVLLASLVFERIGHANAEQEVGAALDELARQVAGQLDRGLFERHREVRAIAALPSMRSADFSAADKRAVLENLQRTYPLYAWLGLANADGQITAATGRLLEGESVRGRQWFTSGLQAPYLGDVHPAQLLARMLPASADGEPPRFVDIAAPVLDTTGRPLGVVGAHLYWDWAREIETALLAGHHRARGIEVLVHGRDGQLLLGPQSARDAAERDYVVGSATTTGYRDAPGLGWTVLARQPAMLALAAYDASRARLLAAGLLTGLLLAALGWAAASHTARPLQRMAAAAEAVRSGRAVRYDARLPPRADELAQLDQIFTAVVDHLRDEQRTLRQEIDERRRLEAQRDELFADVVAARQEAIASHERLSEVVERINDGIVALDHDWCYTFLNRRAAHMLGRDKPEDLLGRHIWTEYPEGVGQPFYHAYQRALAEQQPQTLEQHYAPWDLWFENRIYPSADGLTIFFTDVTERKLAEAQLRESEMRFRATFEQAATGIALLSLSGRWLQVNERLCAILGYPHDELLAASFEDVTDADDLAADLAQSQRLLAGEITGYQLENRCLHKSGRIVWVNLSVALVRNPTGKPAYFIAVIEDIDARKRAEQAAAESEARFRATFEQAAVGIALVAPDGRWLQVNQRLCGIVGYTHDELLACSFQDITHPDDLAADLGLVQRVLAGELATYQMEKRYLHRSGRVVWINLTVSLVRSDAGAPDYFISVVEDIDARKRAEQAAAESEARFHLLVDAVEDYAIFMLDAHGRIASWNRGAERILGHSADEVLGRELSLFYPDAAIAAGEPRRTLEMTRAHGRFTAEESLHRRKDGTEFWANVAITAIHDADGRLRGFAKVVRDVSERRATLAALQQAMQRLRMLSASLIDVQEAERKRVARELHDEIGQSLTAVKIVLQTSALSRSCGGCPELADAVAITDRALEHVRTLSRNLRPPQLDDLGLAAALQAHANWVSRHGGPPIHFAADLLPGAIDDQVATACFRIAQEAITNVQRHAQASAVWLELRRIDGGLLLSVRDDGRGFDLAAATARAAAGASLGVLSMQERCELAGGRLELLSAPGAGCTVRAGFPVAFHANRPAHTTETP
ncbi:PAS domain S-box protein [Aromatoleum evansii]|uniref:PAS domain S-box protein n=1 Tax=Aromatoleum evansii TaxID=59406 RepID=UPI00145D0837|nr:PAS domain S-box protein [Aromatoleum evansii]NMG31620.1 PAS domain S-box protein [Aromatoleum evansii]